MKKYLVIIGCLIAQASLADLKTISKLVNSEEVQKLEMSINAEGGQVIGVMEDVDSLVPGSTVFTLVYSDKNGKTYEVKNLSVSAGPVGGVK